MAVEADEVVDGDPRHPLSTVAESPSETGLEERELQGQLSATGRLHITRAHVHHAHAGSTSRVGRRLPGLTDERQEVIAGR